MFRSLRTRLILATIAIVVISVGVVGILSTRVSRQEFDRYVVSTRKMDLSRFEQPLLESFRTDRWDGVQSVLERIGSISQSRLFLVSADQTLIAAWPDDVVRSKFHATSNHALSFEVREERFDAIQVNEMALEGVPHLVLMNDRKQPVGLLYATDLHFDQGEREKEQFAFSVSRGVLLSVTGAALFAFVLTLVLSRRLLTPIEQLTQATRLLKQGDLSHRVPVASIDETGELARSFNEMAAKLQRAEQLRRNMVGDIAHELRTPLTNIRGQLESIQDGLVKPDTSIIQSLHEETMLLNALIDDLQELALADAGQLRLSIQELDLKQEVESVVKTLEPFLARKRIAVTISNPPNLPTVSADSKRVSQTLRNLLSNSVAHTPEGGAIRISTKKANGHVEISVADNGEGISSEDLPFIFERFFRSDRSRNRKTGGTGLGLAIVQHIVLAHKGNVHAESKAGEGTTITFTLPLSSS